MLGDLEENLRTTETSSILFGLYFFIFVCYTEFYHLKTKAYQIIIKVDSDQ